MNGIHDMGGMQDMGPIEREENEPVFHHPWEGRVYAMNRAMNAWGSGISTQAVTVSSFFPLRIICR